MQVYIFLKQKVFNLKLLLDAPKWEMNYPIGRRGCLNLINLFTGFLARRI